MVTADSKDAAICKLFKTYYNALSYLNINIDVDESYIDSTIILNKLGYSDTVGYNGYRINKHYCNALSLISSKMEYL